MLRRLLASLLPEPLLRAIIARRTRRFLATVGPPTEQFVERHGLEVRGGPFAGMRYLPGLERSSGDLVAKLLGSYERELHGALAQLIALAPSVVIDVGCAEGYYAVGLARALPQARVFAYDVDARARADCAQLARINGVEDRVVLGERCDAAELSRFAEEGVAVFCDCEGCELGLLDPLAVPGLRGWPMIVELHDFIDPATTGTIRNRFAASHAVALIDGEPRRAGVHPELGSLSESVQLALLGENRPGPMRWAWLAPLGPAGAGAGAPPAGPPS